MCLAKLCKGILFSVEQVFVGRVEIRAPIKTPVFFLLLRSSFFVSTDTLQSRLGDNATMCCFVFCSSCF